jgi:hypothetical protein
MIDPTIQRSHILGAIEHLAKKGWSRRNNSTKFDLRWRGKRFPPKEVIRQAADLVGVELDPFGGGNETNSFLAKRGFVVVGKHGLLLALKPVEENPEVAFSEGAVVFRRHRARERNGRAPQLAKEQRLARAGEFRCDVCDFSFVDVFGERGDGFIEAHHDRPLSLTDGPVRTRASDFSLVCSNCHRMLHQTPWLTVRDLRATIHVLAPANDALQRPAGSRLPAAERKDV